MEDGSQNLIQQQDTYLFPIKGKSKWEQDTYP